ncbi:hypothetical protein EVG20_g4510 [Dentipellis fragilis]|uniref:Uncharacterized protein n=1 Tax=Dentipellis fragilis TaxID=205917 RepID=A0A4Y9YVH5_9AGAM|nr:hypothetical protein EVG20_g4510 [Dentipellis fragilis]
MPSLLRRSQTVRGCSQSLRRSYSNKTVTSYPKAVKAFPFKYTVQEAVRLCGPRAKLLTLSLRDFLPSILAVFFPSLAKSPPQPSEVRAFYYPTWIVDAEVQAKAITKQRDKRKDILQYPYTYAQPLSPEDICQVRVSRTLLRTFAESSSITGDTAKHLRNMVFNDRQLFKDTPLLPWSDSLLRQHDTPITCVPYTISPFSLPEFLPTVDKRWTTVADNLSFSPSSIKCNVISASPVLVPIYVLAYDDTSLGPLQVIFEAHTGRGWVTGPIMTAFADDSMKSVYEMMWKRIPGPSLLPYYENRWMWLFQLAGPRPAPAASISGLYGLPVGQRQSERCIYAISHWVNACLWRGIERPPLYHPDGVDMSNPRIRAYDAAERKQTEKWMTSLPASIVTRDASTKEQYLQYLGKSGAISSPEELRAMKDKLKDYTFDRDALLPPWCRSTSADASPKHPA